MTDEVSRAIERAENDWFYPMARRDRAILAEEVKRLWEYERLDERIREVMDMFYAAPHTCGGTFSAKCVACLYIELNKALLPGWKENA